MSEGETILRAVRVGKKFCRNLKFTMRYGVHEMMVSALGVVPNTTRLRRFEFWALNDITLDLHKGHIVGVIGRNGCGKTTLLRVLAGIFPPDRGEIVIGGRLATLITAGAGFHPTMSVRENIYLSGTIFGLHYNQITDRFGRIVTLSGLQEVLDAPLGTLSAGQYVRLGFAIATATQPDILLIDEILSLGDKQFGEVSRAALRQISRQGGIVMVSHNMELIAEVCTDVLVMEQGRIVHYGSDVAEGIRYYEEEIMGSSSMAGRE